MRSRPEVVLPPRSRSSTSGCRCSPTRCASRACAVQQVDWRIPAGGDLELVAALERLYGPRSRRDRHGQRRGGAPARPGRAAARRRGPCRRRSCLACPSATLLHCGRPSTGPTCATRCGARCGPRRWPRAGPRTLPRRTGCSRTARPARTGQRARHRGADGDARSARRRRCWWSTTPPGAPGRSPRSTRDRARLPGSAATRRRRSNGCGSCATSPARCCALVVPASGPIDLFALAAQGVQMGDDVHMRTQGTTNLLVRNLLPAAAALPRPTGGWSSPASCPATTCSS